MLTTYPYVVVHLVVDGIRKLSPSADRILRVGLSSNTTEEMFYT